MKYQLVDWIKYHSRVVEYDGNANQKDDKASHKMKITLKYEENLEDWDHEDACGGV